MESSFESVVDQHRRINDWIAAYAQTGKPLRWPVSPLLAEAVKVSYRNRLANSLFESPVAEIAHRCVYLQAEDLAEMLELVRRHLFGLPLRGIGLELGAGPGLLSAVAARRPEVQAILAVEICENFAPLIQRVAAGVLGSEAGKVIPVVGSFDCLQLPDGSVDFALDHDSLHHSDDLTVTMTECARVLKPGGFLICFDRAHPDTVTDEQVAQMLNEVYSPEFLAFHDYPPGVTLTRRDNGEHEYRMFEWLAATRSAGLELVAYRDFVRRVSWKQAAKGFTAVLPPAIRERMSIGGKPALKNTVKYLRQLPLRWNRKGPLPAPQKSNVMVMRKL